MAVALWKYKHKSARHWRLNVTAHDDATRVGTRKTILWWCVGLPPSDEAAGKCGRRLPEERVFLRWDVGQFQNAGVTAPTLDDPRSEPIISLIEDVRRVWKKNCSYHAADCREELAPRGRFELPTFRLTAEWENNLSALSGVACTKTGAILPPLVAPNRAPN
jgi:hypothetical protein